MPLEVKSRLALTQNAAPEAMHSRVRARSVLPRTYIELHTTTLLRAYIHVDGTSGANLKAPLSDGESDVGPNKAQSLGVMITDHPADTSFQMQPMISQTTKLRSSSEL